MPNWATRLATAALSVAVLVACAMDGPTATATEAEPAATRNESESFVTYQGLRIKSTEESSAQWREQYAGFTEHKASAMAVDESGEWAVGWSESQSGILPAVGAAIRGCEQSRVQKGIDAPCELARVNDAELELGRAFAERMGIDDETQPANVWRYAQGESVVYLAGSIHALKPTLYPLSTAYERSFEAADELVVEVDATSLSPQKMMVLRNKHLMLPDGQTLDDVLGDATLAEVQDAVSELGIPWAAVANLKPGALAAEIAQAVFMTQGALPQHGVDMHYMQRALEREIPIAEIETAERQMALLADAPMDVQTAESESAIEQLEDAQGMFQEMLEAWYSGDLDAVAEIMERSQEEDPELEAWYEALFAERNVGMADYVAALLDGEPRTYFVLIGAGHLSGDDNVIALLAEQGIEGERLRRDGTPL